MTHIYASANYPSLVHKMAYRETHRRQAIIWTSAGILLLGHSRTNFNDMFFEIQALTLKEIYLKISSAKLRPFCVGISLLSARFDSFRERVQGTPLNICTHTTTLHLIYNMLFIHKIRCWHHAWPGIWRNGSMAITLTNLPWLLGGTLG